MGDSHENDDASWLDRERRATADAARERQARVDAKTKTFEIQAARLRAHGADDGRGFCQWCRCILSHDDHGRALHPDNGCPGPPPDPCPRCGKRYVVVNGRWHPTCSPDSHADAELLRAQSQALSSMTPGATDPLSRARARRIADDDDT